MKERSLVRTKRQSTVRQTQIVDAARRLIIRYGSEHVTIRRIAKEVGISEAAIYRHFKSKKDILSLLADHTERDLLSDIAVEESAGGSPLQILHTVLRNHISAIKQRRGIGFQVIAEIVSLGDKKLNKRMSDTIDKYISRLKVLLSEAVKAKEVREDIDLEAVAMLLFGMIQGLVNIWALSNYNFDLEDKYAPLWETFRKSIAQR